MYIICVFICLILITTMLYKKFKEEEENKNKLLREYRLDFFLFLSLIK